MNVQDLKIGKYNVTPITNRKIVDVIAVSDDKKYATLIIHTGGTTSMETVSTDDFVNFNIVEPAD